MSKKNINGKKVKALFFLKYEKEDYNKIELLEV